MTPEQLADFESRLERALATLQDMLGNYSFGADTYLRIRGKVEGVQLALSYLEEYRR